MSFWKRPKEEGVVDAEVVQDSFLRDQPRPMGLGLKVLLGVIIALLLGYAFNSLFGGALGAGFYWFRGVDAAIWIATWRFEMMGWLALAAWAVTAFMARYAFPTIIVPILGAGEHEAKQRTIWYKAFSVEVEGDMATWIEGRKDPHRAYVNKNYLVRLHGLGYLISKPVLRKVDRRNKVIYYESVDLEASKLDAQMQRERMLHEELVMLRERYLRGLER